MYGRITIYCYDCILLWLYVCMTLLYTICHYCIPYTVRLCKCISNIIRCTSYAVKYNIIYINVHCTTYLPHSTKARTTYVYMYVRRTYNVCRTYTYMYVHVRTCTSYIVRWVNTGIWWLSHDVQYEYDVHYIVRRTLNAVEHMHNVHITMNVVRCTKINNVSI